MNANATINSILEHSSVSRTGAETSNFVSAPVGLFLWTIIFGCLVKWRSKEALDHTKNNQGIAQWSSTFYTIGGSSLKDFINALPYMLNLAPIATVYLGIHLWQTTGDAFWTFLTFFVGFGAVPIADLIIGEDSYNPTKEEETALRSNIWFRIHTIFYVWAYVASVCYLSKFCGNPDNGVELFSSAFWGISTSAGIASGFGIGCIHELIHRPTFTEMNHGRLVLLFCNYNHFWIEHLWGHHKRVATEEDPASSAINENFWTFIWKCLYLSFVSACRIEAKFQKRHGRTFWTIYNRILVPYFLSLVIDFAIYHYFGPVALGFHLVQSFLTAFLTDNANYIEHYGLRRERLSDKKDEWGWYSDYERPGWMHAWNTGDRITNWMLFKIERHPDHHVNAGRPYQILRTYKESPTYPTGYAGMFVLSWFPPIFRMVMNPIAEKAREDYARQLKSGTYNKIFPAGANNISSAYKKTGEDFFVKGSSEYGGGVDKDADSSGSGAVWNGANKKRI